MCVYSAQKVLTMVFKRMHTVKPRRPPKSWYGGGLVPPLLLDFVEVCGTLLKITLYFFPKKSHSGRFINLCFFEIKRGGRVKGQSPSSPFSFKASVRRTSFTRNVMPQLLFSLRFRTCPLRTMCYIAVFENRRKENVPVPSVS